MTLVHQDIPHKFYINKRIEICWELANVRLFTNQMRVNNLNLQTYLLIEASKKGFPDQCGKFVRGARDIERAILIFSIYLLLNFRNLDILMAFLFISFLVRSINNRQYVNIKVNTTNMQCQMNGEVAIIIVYVQNFQPRNDTAGIARKFTIFPPK